MTEVNSAESYYQYRAESDASVKSMTAEINRLKNEVRDSNLATATDRQVPDPDVSNLIFKLVSGSCTETDNGITIGDKTLTQAIESIRSNEGLKNFFSGADIPVTVPQRQFKNWFDE
jgi:hypothetical protein